MSKRKKIYIFMISYLIALTGFIRIPAVMTLEEGNLAVACLKCGLPAVSFEEESKSFHEDEPAVARKKETSKPKKKKATKHSGKPLVLIYHTHSTESYLPSSKGNYHSIDEKNTVRQVGDVLAESLEEEGIGVIHDKTIHDNPSYDSAYERSHNTAAALVKKYPSIICVIDLHRDALPNGYTGSTCKVKGKKCSNYSFVIGTQAPTFESNDAFVSKLNDVAGKKYDGYTGKVMYRDYIYNQDLSKKSLLLELGNNRNYIDDVENCAEIIGKIIADSI